MISDVKIQDKMLNSRYSPEQPICEYGIQIANSTQGPKIALLKAIVLMLLNFISLKTYYRLVMNC